MAKQELPKDDYELPCSMIDVVFLLLIFFLVCSSYKTTEERLEANLPRDGLNPVAQPTIMPRPEVRVKLWLAESGQVRISVDEYACSTIDDLARKLAAFAGGDPNQDVVIDGRQQVPFKYVLAAIDACARAGMRNVKFQAPPVPGGGGSDWWYQ
jgi:biopolymer transport protein ExbD